MCQYLRRKRTYEGTWIGVIMINDFCLALIRRRNGVKVDIVFFWFSCFAYCPFLVEIFYTSEWAIEQAFEWMHVWKRERVSHYLSAKSQRTNHKQKKRTNRKAASLHTAQTHMSFLLNIVTLLTRSCFVYSTLQFFPRFVFFFVWSSYICYRSFISLSRLYELDFCSFPLLIALLIVVMKHNWNCVQTAREFLLLFLSQENKWKISPFVWLFVQLFLCLCLCVWCGVVCISVDFIT